MWRALCPAGLLCDGLGWAPQAGLTSRLHRQAPQAGPPQAHIQTPQAGTTGRHPTVNSAPHSLLSLSMCCAVCAACAVLRVLSAPAPLPPIICVWGGHVLCGWYAKLCPPRPPPCVCVCCRARTLSWMVAVRCGPSRLSRGTPCSSSSRSSKARCVHVCMCVLVCVCVLCVRACACVHSCVWGRGRAPVCDVGWRALCAGCVGGTSLGLGSLRQHTTHLPFVALIIKIY